MYKEARFPFDIGVEDGQILNVGTLELKIIYTPGHSQDCICILVENKLITGDTLFVGKIGGTTSDEAARAQYQSLHKKILTLDEKVQVIPDTIAESELALPLAMRRKIILSFCKTPVRNF